MNSKYLDRIKEIPGVDRIKYIPDREEVYYPVLKIGVTPAEFIKLQILGPEKDPLMNRVSSILISYFENPDNHSGSNTWKEAIYIDVICNLKIKRLLLHKLVGRDRWVIY